MLTLVTGADNRYMHFLKKLLNNIIKIIKNKNHNNIDINIVVYDLGLTDENIEKIKSYKNIFFETFDFNKYPDHVSLNKYFGNNCSYAWKPIIIHEVCEKYGGLIHWMDTRTLYSDFNELIDVLKNEYIYTPRQGGTIGNWTYKTTTEYMEGYPYLNKKCRAGGIFGINYNIQWCKEFVTEWKNLALVKECICPEGSDRSNHRQDQSVLSILYYKYHEKYKFKIINNNIKLNPHMGVKVKI